MSFFPKRHASGETLREILERGSLVRAPGCFDALSARVVEQAGFSVGFLGGFSVAAARLGLPDVGLLSYGEMVEQARDVCAATSLPIIGDADTGYGNAINAERTLLGCTQAGLAGVMIEDQQWPKRCGHTSGKSIVDRQEALARVRACVRAREEQKLDVLLMARTDANATDGFDEALWRAQAFADAGADITFLEAPSSVEQMERYCRLVPGWTTANLVEDGKTPWLEPAQLEEIGYSIVLYPVALLLHSVFALRAAADGLAGGVSDGSSRVKFDQVRDLLGWDEYERRLQSIEADPNDTKKP
ncbi:MAG: isocitrate lyase/PEP mutase family protein [Candidatus Binatia bacterium]|nr:isocitrate lyase/PEP mutase family protein [Candidatus Binatia bacterium]